MPLMSPKAVEAFNSYERYLLLTGARRSSKTLSGICNKMARHAWEVDGAVIALIGKTLRNAEGGTWKDLLQFTLPGWIHAGFGMQIVQNPTYTPDSRLLYFRVNNMWEGKSEFQLHSLDHDDNVEAKFKSLRFSMIVLAEVDQFKHRKVIEILSQQLRMTHLPREMHQMLMDCNPPEEGEDHWLYPAFMDRDEKNTALFSDSKAIEFELDDNPFIPEVEKEDLRKTYSYDPIKYDRFVRGRWVKDTTAGHFDSVFQFNIHVLGNTDSPKRDDWQVIVPPNTPLLITGSDLGEINHATVFMYARELADNLVAYDIFDELVSLETPVSISEFGRLLAIRVAEWTEFVVSEYKLKRPPAWRHWVDSSAMNYRAGSGSSDAAEIYSGSGETIAMLAAKKGPHTRNQRITLVKRLFFSNRLLISAQCRHCIEWARFLRPGKTKADIIDPSLRCRHTFDAATYALSSELPIEIERSAKPKVTNLRTVFV